ncbi:MAG: hypothetical protein CVU41_06390 [Chloroflexi bacterium HGW-Chloroflexi-3]|nr:MAG: hypothetical protein CVU41_06390 [Chloroflexi bacterium HGW-Chloroflexi-3]
MRKSILKTVLFVMILSVLSACTLPLTQATPPAVSDEEMATRVAKILTEMPQPTQGLPTAELPPLNTPEPDPTLAEEVVETVTEAATSQPEQPTVTQQPTATSDAVPTVAVTANPAFTPPADDPRSKLGSPSWTDNMDKDTYWPTGEDKYTAIDFKDGQLRLTGLTTTDGWRLAATEQIANFYLEATISTGTCAGTDRYGLMYRVPVAREANKGYLLGVSCDGKYSLREWDATLGSKGTMTTHINWTASNAIQAGSNKMNKVGIMAVGDRMIIYINGVMINEVKDATFPEGSFGLFVGARETTNFTISVDEVSYWKNPTP